jgi:hypothetical protein
LLVIRDFDCGQFDFVLAKQALQLSNRFDEWVLVRLHQLINNLERLGIEIALRARCEHCTKAIFSGSPKRIPRNPSLFKIQTNSGGPSRYHLRGNFSLFSFGRGS